MVAEKVKLPQSKKNRKNPLPSATHEDVTSFCNDQSCHPSLDRVAMAWFEPLTSKWNQECIALLAKKAQSTLRVSIAAKECPQYDKQWLTLPYLSDRIEKALKLSKEKLSPDTESPMSSSPSSSPRTSLNDKIARRAAKSRRRSRKIQVMISFSCT